MAYETSEAIKPDTPNTIHLKVKVAQQHKNIQVPKYNSQKLKYKK